MKNIKTSIREFLGNRAILNQSIEDVVEVLNPMLRGWMNYFRYGNSDRKFRQIDGYIREELALWWSKKHQKSGSCWSSGFTDVMYRNCDIQLLSGNVRYWSC